MRKMSFWERMRGSLLGRFLVSALAMACGLLASRLLGTSIGAYAAFVVVLPAIAFCAWYAGIWPSIVSTILATAALKYWFIPPVQSIAFTSARGVIGELAFLTACGLLIAMAEAHGRENLRLREAETTLESRVKERTAELDHANKGLRELSAQLMKLQDDERRRIARELHDSVGQILAALTMNLTEVGSDLERLIKTAAKVLDSAALVQQMNQEVRTVSYLLHPPLLDEAGLASALRWYATGFAERSKIQIDLKVDENLGRLPQDLETTLFRIVQECLTNIHRHSGSAVASIHLTRNSDEIRLKVEDEGSGMSREKLDELMTDGTPGVGIRGMRERMRQFGGNLEIRSNDNGTTVEACLPVATLSEVTTSGVAA